jgi:hypothetical protein
VLKFREEASRVLHFEHSFVCCSNLDTSGCRSEIPGKFRNVVLVKDGEEEFDRSCEKRRSVIQSQGEKEYPKSNIKKEC